jgi:predicted unusual protein kinase regulating ubiquinone biosynthesis (AarF/ABC1/UbiB family)
MARSGNMSSPPQDDEASRFSKRARRYVGTSRTVGALAAKVAGEHYLGIKMERTREAQTLRKALGGLKGPLMKVAQILASIPDAIPKEYAEELRQLQANAPPMDSLFVRRRMTGQLGHGWQEQFAEFEPEAAHAASLGQVHRATMHDGRQVACKLQYPDMASVVEADLKQLKLIFSLYSRFDKAIQTDQIYEEVAARLREELDYEREAKQMRLYANMLADEPGVHVPEPVPSLSTNRLVTMSWLDGIPLLEAAQRPAEERNQIAYNMFRAWYVPFYNYGIIHGDPHLGNYTVRADNSVNLLDYGCIRVFPPSFVQGVIDLYKAIRDKDQALAVHAYETWGFVSPSRELIDVLNLWAEFIYAPLMQDRVQKIQESDNGQYGAQVAEKVHAELRKLGGVRPPREFVMMDRAAVGLGSVFMHLKAEVNWYQLFHELIGDFDTAALEARQSEALAAVGLERPLV